MGGWELCFVVGTVVPYGNLTYRLCKKLCVSSASELWRHVLVLALKQAPSQHFSRVHRLRWLLSSVHVSTWALADAFPALPKSSAELCLQLALQLQCMRDLVPTALGLGEMFCVSLQEAPPPQTHLQHKTAQKCLSNQQRNRSCSASCVFMHSNTCPLMSLCSMGTWHLLLCLTSI